MTPNPSFNSPAPVAAPSASRHLRRSAGACTLALTLLAGCAGLTAPPQPELQVRALATQRWQALMSGDFDKAYAFSVPSYRQLRSIGYYRGKRQATPVKWLSAEVLRVECAPEKCSVRIQLESKPLVPFQFSGTLEAGLDETWVFEDGKWWIFETL